LRPAQNPNVWTLFRHLQIGSLDALRGNGIHHLSNVITLSVELHMVFDDLQIWFEATVRFPFGVGIGDGNIVIQDEPHVYKLGCTQGTVQFLRTYGLEYGKRIEFRSHMKEMPTECLPSSAYLQLHECACKVAAMSGALKYLDKLDDELVDMEVEEEDPELARLLLDNLSLVPNAAQPGVSY
jgi:hypothetical protein